MKRNQGITLIALIITIIIMLILVAVTIDVVVDGKLFDTAKEAVDKTNNKVGETQDRVDGLMNELDDVYEWQENQSPKEHNWQYTDNTLASLKCTCSICGGERIVHVGQEIPSYTGGPAGTQWVVFGAEDSDNNGTNETLLLTTLEPSEELELEGADGYNNGIEKIEAKVKEIYGNEARSMKIEDVNRTLGYTPAGGMYIDDNILQTTGNFTTKLKELSTWNNIKAYGTATPDGENSEEALGEYEVDGYFYTVTKTEAAAAGLPYAPAGTSNEAKNLVFGTKDTPYSYWLASRGVYANPDVATFGTGSVIIGYAYSCYYLLYSYGDSLTYSFSVRPVVSLKSEIPAGGEILVSSEAWEVG